MSEVTTKVARDEDLEQLRRDCMLSSSVGIPLFSSLPAMVFRAHDRSEWFEVWGLILGGAQSGLLREGMRKLGIRDDEPPAVQAGKYHYLSNILGGLRLEYIEESEKKVWLRYRGPYQMMPNISAIAFPPTLRRHQFSTWHARNRHFLGYPRLGWVYTKTALEGDPYDEGYFIEYDHDIDDVIADGSAVVRHTPEFDPAKAPKLDPAQWPESRQLKARRNYALGYVAQSTQALLDVFGELETCHMIDTAVRILAMQLCRDWIADLEITDTDFDACVALVTGLMRALGQPYQVERLGDRHVRLVVPRARPFDTFPVEVRAAYAPLYETCIRFLSGRVRWTFAGGDEGEPDVFEMEEADHWLW